jgi:hypothetical protein
LTDTCPTELTTTMVLRVQLWKLRQATKLLQLLLLLLL